MILKIVDNAGMAYPKVVNAETGEEVKNIISIRYNATAQGRTCVIELVTETDITMKFVAESNEGIK